MLAAPQAGMPPGFEGFNGVSFDDVERALCEASLVDFAMAGWRNVEPGPMQVNWHVEAICDHLEAVARGEIKRLLINLPPRHMKSLAANVFFPAWIWTHDAGYDSDGNRLAIRPGTWLGPGTKLTFMSYAQDLTTRDSVACRRLIDSPWYQNLWGDRFSFSEDQNTKTRYINSMGGFRMALSLSGRITGEGADILVLDDPHNIRGLESPVQREEVLRTWDEVLPTRLNDPARGVFIVIMQRAHQRDLTGHILSKEIGWTHLCLPARYEANHPTPFSTKVRRSSGERKGEVWDDLRAPNEPLWPGRFTDEILDEWSQRLGTYATAGQLQQRPAPREGGMFKISWFAGRRIPRMKVPAVGQRVRAWDFAASEATGGLDPDYTVGVRMIRDHNGLYYVEDVQRIRGSALEVRRLVQACAEGDPPGTIIRLPKDPGAAGKNFNADMVRHLAGYTVRLRDINGDKEQRASPFSAQCEAGNVYVVEAPWTQPWLDELCIFPNGDHDDQVDASADAFAELTLSRKGGGVFGG